MRPVVCSVCKKMYKSALTDVYEFFIAGFQSRDTFSTWWSTPNGNTVGGSS